MKISKAALLAAMLAGSAALIATPAAAQRAPRGNQAAQAAGQQPNWAAVQAALPAAQAAARGNDAKYLISRIQLALATTNDNMNAQEAAITALLANPGTPPAEAVQLRGFAGTILNKRAEQAFAANDFATAERIYSQVLQANPTDQRVISNLAIVRSRMGNTTGALEAVMQQIRTQEAANQRADEALYQRALSVVYTARDRTQSLDLATRLATHYPTATNWRQAIGLYREFGRPDENLTVDSFRLARAAGALAGEADYLGFAQMLDQAGLPGETKAVIDEGLARNAFPSSRQGVSELLAKADNRIREDRVGLDRQIAEARAGTSANLPRAVADALYGYGRYAEAADLYRVALGKSGADANRLNLRIGAALAMGNQRAEAEAALRTVTGQPADLAKLWLAWLSRRQG